MNGLTLSLFCCVVQVSVLGTVALLTALSVMRMDPRATRWVYVFGLIGMLISTCLAWSAWPRWDLGRSLVAQQEQAENRADSQEPFADPSELDRRGDGETDSASMSEGIEAASDLDDRAFDEMSAIDWGEVVRTMGPVTATEVDPANTSTPLTWQQSIAWILVGVSVFGLTRFCWGLISLHSFIRRCDECEDADLIELVGLATEQLGVNRPRIKVSSSELSAAMVGWWKPTLLLPAAWRNWSHTELSAVVMHELSHLKRGDFFLSILGQLCVAFHFYHPLVHWLVSRLRLEMEFAADETAARMLGSNPRYMQTLAGLALRQETATDQETLCMGWPARPFLPTRGTLIRRIEMLRCTTKSTSRRSWAAVGVVCLVMASSLVGVLGLRIARVSGIEVTHAESAHHLGVVSADDGPPMVYIPSNVSNLISLRVPLMIENDFIAENLTQALLSELPTPFAKPASMERVTLLAFGPAVVVDGGSTNAWVIQYAEDVAVDLGEFVVAEESLGVECYRLDEVRMFAAVDARTILIGDKDSIDAMLANGREAGISALESEEWQRLKDMMVSIYLDSTILSGIERAASDELVLSLFSPIWTETESISAGIGWEEGISAKVIMECPAAESLDTVEATAEALFPLMRNALATWVNSMSETDDLAPIAQLLPYGIELLENAELNRIGDDRLQISVFLPNREELYGVLLSAAGEFQAASRRTTDVNDARQIALAMYIYHETHREFPPAVLYHTGADGKRTAHSWRVALLPYLDQADLYEQYELDEPWDSENNLRVLEQMPDVYRSGFADPGSTDSCYFAIVGEGHLFQPGSGTDRFKITDGTSNTLAFVQAKVEIPWTRPSDLGWNADEPQLWDSWLTRGRIIALADGSVMILPMEVETSLIGSLLTINGGELIDWNGLR